jgi:hypothetical protein
MAVRLSALRAGRPLPPGRFLILISVRGLVDPRATVRLEGLGQLNNPMTALGIQPMTRRLVHKGVYEMFLIFLFRLVCDATFLKVRNSLQMA